MPWIHARVQATVILILFPAPRFRYSGITNRVASAAIADLATHYLRTGGVSGTYTDTQCGTVKTPVIHVLVPTTLIIP